MSKEDTGRGRLDFEKTNTFPAAFASVEICRIPKKGSKQSEDYVKVNSSRTLVTITDGMGGHKDASRASQRIAELIEEKLNNINPILYSEVVKRQEDAYIETHQQIQSEYPTTGTCAATVSLWDNGSGKIGIITWVGDSRVYLVREQHIQRLTEDMDSVTKDIPRETLYQVIDDVDKIKTSEEYDSASLSTQAVWNGRKRKLQPSHIGNYFNGEEFFVVQSIVVPLQPGDRVVLVTDGVSDNLTTEEILVNSQSAERLTEAAQTSSQKGSYRSTNDDTSTIIAIV